MVTIFRLGGLYWHNLMGYVECTRKTEDIAELAALRDGRKALAYDGDEDYEDAKSGVLERHVKSTQDKVWKLKHELKEKETYLARLKEPWPMADKQPDPWTVWDREKKEWVGLQSLEKKETLTRAPKTLGEHKPGEEME